jgi:hypothetical protein
MLELSHDFFETMAYSRWGCADKDNSVPGCPVAKLLKRKTLLFREGLWSERRDSNSRPRPWQGRALPTELLSHWCFPVSSCVAAIRVPVSFSGAQI